MRYIILAVLFLLSLILPGTLFHFWSWSGIKPDLLMLLVIYIALHQNRWQSGALWGFGAGLLADLYFGRYVGMYTFTLTVVALLTGWLAQRWYRENFLLITLFVFMITTIGQLTIAFLSIGTGLHFLAQDIIKTVLGISLYNTILVPVTYPWIHKSFLNGWLRYRPKYER